MTTDTPLGHPSQYALDRIREQPRRVMITGRTSYVDDQGRLWCQWSVIASLKMRGLIRRVDMTGQWEAVPHG